MHYLPLQMQNLTRPMHYLLLQMQNLPRPMHYLLLQMQNLSRPMHYLSPQMQNPYLVRCTISPFRCKTYLVRWTISPSDAKPNSSDELSPISDALSFTVIKKALIHFYTPNTSIIAFALSKHSSYSFSGTESKVIALPTINDKYLFDEL
jgi:hypothetical protein